MSQILDRGIEKKSEVLSGRRIALGACGGIGSVELVKVIRELRRHGAEVFPFLTPQVTRFITELSLEWAAGRGCVTQLKAEVDHLEHFDLALIAPLTLNTLSKCALGLADNPVTLLVASQLGQKSPICFVPAMNLALMKHPLFKEHQAKLESWGARFLLPPEEEGRLKMPDPIRLVEAVVEQLKAK